MKTRAIYLLLVFSLLMGSCDFLGLTSPIQSGGKGSITAQTVPGSELEQMTETPLVNEQEEKGALLAPADNEIENPLATQPVLTPVINPLTGLPAAHPENLRLPPALVSITNFPPSARPQAGLAVSPIVFELYIGDGMTRYLAIFYGEYPTSIPMKGTEDVAGELTSGMTEPVIGPVRSGRIPYEHIRKLYNGFIVMASAYSRVADQIHDYVNFFGDDQSDVNSAMVAVDDIEAIAQETEKELGDTALGGMAFDATAPEGGQDAQSIWLYYSFKNQVFWRFNEADGSYHRWQDNADGVTFIEQTDRLTDEPLSYENVIVLLVDHQVEQKYFIDLDLLYVEKDKALIFRDGEVHQAYWTTKSEEYEQTTGKLRPIRFIDAEGNPFPLKPGQTWIELIPTHSPIWETVDSEKYHLRLNGRSKGSGHWAVWFKIDN